ncbi:hypothetical protein OSTOST_01062, partial [Ostertagia ostertagi]
MDFMQLLDTANKNAKSLSKKLDVLKSEVDNEKRAELRRIEAEKKVKMESLKRKKETVVPTEEERKFTIPKRRKESEEDKAKVLAYLAKKSEEERQALKKRQAEKERLIQLRLQAHGGKALKNSEKLRLSALDSKSGMVTTMNTWTSTEGRSGRKRKNRTGSDANRGGCGSGELHIKKNRGKGEPSISSYEVVSLRSS